MLRPYRTVHELLKDDNRQENLPEVVRRLGLAAPVLVSHSAKATLVIQ